MNDKDILFKFCVGVCGIQNFNTKILIFTSNVSQFYMKMEMIILKLKLVNKILKKTNCMDRDY